MADRIEIGKVFQSVVVGSPTDTIDVSKVVMYVILAPGTDTSQPARQAHVYSQKITRV